MEIRAYIHSDQGPVRDENQDRALIDEELNVYVVADGMGGHAAGSVASQTAVDVVKTTLHENREVIERFGETGDGRAQVTKLLENAIRRAGVAIFQMAQDNIEQRGMGTTLSVLLLTQRRGFIAHVGDSRIYIIRQSDTVQLTEDHSLINELIKQGRISPEQVKTTAYTNAITRAVGVYADVQVDTLDFELAAGDTFFLCSDGVSEHLKEPREIADVIEARGVKSAASTLVDLALQRGTRDNATAVVVRITADRGELSIPDGQNLANRLSLLRRMPLFQHLTYVELMEILNMSDVRSYKKGATIFQEGDRGEEFFIILDGTVHIEKGGTLLATIATGGHFGEMAIMDKGARSATTVAGRDSQVIVVGRRPLFALLRKEKDIAVKLLWSFVHVLNYRLRATNTELSEARESNLGSTVVPPLKLDDD